MRVITSEIQIEKTYSGCYACSYRFSNDNLLKRLYVGYSKKTAFSMFKGEINAILAENKADLKYNHVTFLNA